MDEYDLKVHLESLNKWKSCFGIAQLSFEEPDLNSIGSELSIKFESNLITLEAKNHHCSTMGSIADDAPSISLVSFKTSLVRWAYTD